jgi:hypothetical protein
MSHQLSLINSFIFKFLKIMYVCPNDICWVCAQVKVTSFRHTLTNKKKIKEKENNHIN